MDLYGNISISETLSKLPIFNIKRNIIKNSKVQFLRTDDRCEYRICIPNRVAIDSCHSVPPSFSVENYVDYFSFLELTNNRYYFPNFVLALCSKVIFFFSFE